MTDIVPIEFQPLDGYIPDIRHWNEYYRNPITGQSPEATRLILVKKMQDVFQEFGAVCKQELREHIRVESARASITGSRKRRVSKSLDFGSDYSIITDDPNYPVTYRGNTPKAGPTVSGSSVSFTIGGQRVSGTVTAYARLTPEAVVRRRDDRQAELRALLRTLQLQDDVP